LVHTESNSGLQNGSCGANSRVDHEEPKGVNVALFKQAGAKLYRGRPDLQAAFPDADSRQYWAWCHSHGILENPELSQLAPPLPPDELRCLVGAGADAKDFLTSGATLFLAVDELGELQKSRRILDFGCGCGRLLRFLSRYAQQADMVGVDIEPRHIQWTSCNLDFASFTVTQKLPPLLLPDGRFDTVIALSVSSHLPESPHKSWREELARVIASDGHIIITTLGQTAIDAALSSAANFAILQITDKDFSAARKEFREKGFSFVIQPTHSLADYGIAFSSTEWIQHCWNRHFETIAHIPGWLGGWQDGYLLRRR
jgi:2-polyprenyl-3-methyl-5-hydroxy-6-metoxy-1,4-benzoquinol methylase